ncbi:MAG: cytochrome P460 family protein [Paludibaculum sp.]
MMRTLSLLLSLPLLGSFFGAFAQTKGLSDGFKLVDKAGNIRKPNNYREQYQMIGAYTVLDPKGNEMHDTYASPGAAEYYRRNHKFPDGAVLVKEVRATDHTTMTTGDAHWATDTKVWFVLIKDSKERYKDNPIWGDGWGWALFKSDSPDKQVATAYKTDCLICHVPAKEDDWIYVKGYPLLRPQ